MIVTKVSINQIKTKEMKKSHVLSAIMLVTVMFMTSSAYSQSAMDYKSKIDKITKELSKYMVEGNTEASLNLYTADAISMPSYAPMQEGIAAIRKASEDMAKSGAKYNSFELKTVKIIPNGNLITEIGTYAINVTVPGMDQPVDDHGKYLTMYEKQKDGSLKIKIEIWNSDIDPMSRMQKMDQPGADTKK